MAQETEAHEGKDKPGTPFRITIDGEEYETSERQLTVRQVLELAGVDPNTHQLIEIHGRQQEPHDDLNEIIKINSGLKFVTVSREPVPVA
jgi:Multiubiquitin